MVFPVLTNVIILPGQNAVNVCTKRLGVLRWQLAFVEGTSRNGNNCVRRNIFEFHHKAEGRPNNLIDTRRTMSYVSYTHYICIPYTYSPSLGVFQGSFIMVYTYACKHTKFGEKLPIYLQVSLKILHFTFFFSFNKIYDPTWPKKFQSTCSPPNRFRSRFKNFLKFHVFQI